MGLAEQAFQLAVVDHRDHRRTQHAHRDARPAHHPDGPQARLGRRRPGLENALQLIVQSGQADHHRHQALARQLAQQVQVPEDHRALGDDGHRVSIAQQHLQGAPGQLLFALNGLVGIGIGPQVDRCAAIAGLGQLLFQQGRGVALGDQLGFEIQPRGQVPIGVAGPRVAIDATVLATAIGVDGAVEGQVRRTVAGDDRLGRFKAHLGALGQRHFLVPAIILGHRTIGRKTVVRIARGTATTGRQGVEHGSTPLLYVHTVMEPDLPDQHRRTETHP